MPLILPGNVGSATAATGFNVANSLRFRGATADTYLTATFGATPTLATKNTISLWFKRSKFDANQQLYTTNNNAANIIFNRSGASTGPTAAFYTNSGQLLGPKLYRDTSAWMHFVFAFDSTQATAANRFKVYINGVLETTFNNTAYPAKDEASQLGVNGEEIQIGTRSNYDRIFDGYMAETAFVDGQTLDATSFGEFDSDSGIWKPIDISGLTFGNNGFYLEYKGTGTSANSSGIGADTSGNDLHFAINAFTAADQTVDTCTNNFCTVNPLDNYHQQATYSEGNTKITFKGASSVYAWSTGTFGMANGKWYWETKATSAGNHNVYGISGRLSVAHNQSLGRYTDTYGYYNANGNYTNAATDGSYREVSFSGGNVTWGTNAIIGIALDLDSGTNTVKFYKNNALVGTVDIIAPSSGFYYPAWNQFDNQAEVCQPNFGNPSYAISSGNTDGNGYGNFEYAPPSGYFALCTKNLAEFG